MLEPITDVSEPITGVRASGFLNRADCDDVLSPVIARAARQGQKLRLLLELAPDLQGMSLGAVLAKLRLASRHAASLERCAVITASRAASHLIAAAGSFMPFSTRAFGRSERQAALDWLCGPLRSEGAALSVRPDLRVLIVQLHAPLGAEDAAMMDKLLATLAATEGSTLGVVVRMQGLPSWRGLGSLVRHLSFMRGLDRRVHRWALVTDGPLAAATTVPLRRLGTSVRRFPGAEFELAVHWAGRAAAAWPLPRPRARRPLRSGRLDGNEYFPPTDPPPTCVVP